MCCRTSCDAWDTDDRVVTYGRVTETLSQGK